MRILKIVTLWPVIRTGLYALTWLFPPLGFVLWRMRVSKRRHADAMAALTLIPNR